jgi:hypothetical protein
MCTNQNSATRFEEEGVRRQENALNLWQAVKQFKNSCRICCVSGKNIPCGQCHIKSSFMINLDYVFHDQVNPKILEMVKEEREP